MIDLSSRAMTDEEAERIRLALPSSEILRAALVAGALAASIAGVCSGLLGSVALGLVYFWIARSANGDGPRLLVGILAVLIAIVAGAMSLAHMIRDRRSLKSKLKEDVRKGVVDVIALDFEAVWEIDVEDGSDPEVAQDHDIDSGSLLFRVDQTRFVHLSKEHRLSNVSVRPDFIRSSGQETWPPARCVVESLPKSRAVLSVRFEGPLLELRGKIGLGQLPPAMFTGLWGISQELPRYLANPIFDE